MRCRSEMERFWGGTLDCWTPESGSHVGLVAGGTFVTGVSFSELMLLLLLLLLLLVLGLVMMIMLSTSGAGSDDEAVVRLFVSSQSVKFRLVTHLISLMNTNISAINSMCTTQISYRFIPSALPWLISAETTANTAPEVQHKPHANVTW